MQRMGKTSHRERKKKKKIGRTLKKTERGEGRKEGEEGGGDTCEAS